MRHRFDLARIGAGLPVADAEEELAAAARHGAVVVLAPPGTGKTTVVPPLVANLVAGRTLVTQPRRVAVRAAARRVAALDGSALGGPVGYTVRGEREASDATRLEMLTPGVLLRRLLADPTLEGADAVVLDEIHERSLDSDLLLGMLAEVRELREDLLVVAMSATLDADAVAALLRARTVAVPSALHPLEVRHRPGPARLDARGVTRDLLDHLARITAEAHTRDAADALVFVPGAREVDELVRRLRDLVPGSEVLPLHGRLPAAQQDRATAGRSPDDPPRVVVTTALAESSLTVPGVRLVVDAGLSREVRRDRGRDMAGLVTVSASRESVVQRAGRAARQGPGIAVRAFSETDEARMPARSLPQIATADLTDAALLLAAWGTSGGKGLTLWDAPPREAMAQAQAVLRDLGLTGEDDRPTQLGRRIATMPVGVREARALLEGARELGDASAAAEVVAAVSDDHRAEGADLEALLRSLRAGRAPGTARWRRERDRLARLAREHPRGAGTGGGPGTVLALARPERLARRVAEGSRSYLLASGTRAALPEGSSLIGHPWLAVWEVQRAEGRAADGTGAVIRLAAPVTAPEAEDLAGPLLREERTVRIDAQGRVVARQERRIGAIVLSSTPVPATAEDAGPAIASLLREAGLDRLSWTDAARSLRARLALLHRELGEPWPAMDEASLLDRLEDWLGPDLAAQRARPRLEAIDVASALRRLLPWPAAGRLDELVPERLALPGGRSARIDYTDGRPVVAVKLQDLLGARISPRLVDGRVPVQFHLLSPARRPLAVTEDLESFWAGPYQQVRKEMRGRYPKHAWPEDPSAP